MKTLLFFAWLSCAWAQVPRGGMDGGSGITGASAAADAFGRLRVSNPQTLFDSTAEYGKNPMVWDETLGGTGTSVHLTDEAAIRMRVAAANDSVIRQTKRYWRYQPGKSQLVLLTAALPIATANTRQRLGLFDARNGVFFEQTSAGKSVVVRTATSGSAVDTVIPQASWNLDRLDGTGTSGKTLSASGTQIFVIDLEWLGVGRVRFGFNIDGVTYYCHQSLNANVGQTAVYMGTANLPVRYEHTALPGYAGGNLDLKQICSTVVSEGGFEDDFGVLQTANMGITTVAVTTRRPILSIRLSSTFNSVTNNGTIVLGTVDSSAATNNCLFELVLNPTLTGASFSAVDATYSIAEKDTAASSLTGGIVLSSWYVPAGTGTQRTVASRGTAGSVSLGKNLAGTSDILSIVARSFTGTCTAIGSMDWKEIR